jgi:hypothetical protein
MWNILVFLSKKQEKRLLVIEHRDKDSGTNPKMIE